MEVRQGVGRVMINLEEEARKRRERLLRAKHSSAEAQPTATSEEQQQHEISHKVSAGETKVTESNDLVFVAPEGLTDAAGAEILSLDSKIPDTVEAQAKALLAKHQSSASSFFDINAEVDTDFLAPKGQNADLKREYERRTVLLQKQTRRAVVDIVRERLAADEAPNTSGGSEEKDKE